MWSAASYYRRAVGTFSETAQPLFKLLRKDVKFTWGPKQQNAFEALKTALPKCVPLRNPDLDAKFKVATAVTEHSLEVRLFQQLGDEKKLHPIYVASRLLKPFEQGYHKLEKQVLVMVYATKKFRHYLHLRLFEFLVDHAALRYLMTLPIPKGRIGKWVMELSCF